FDDFDVLLLDNNLSHLHDDNDKGGAPLTAESTAGYLRAFTRTCYIVSLNMNPAVDFDLRFLVGDVSTRADLALNVKHVDNRALWTGKPEGGFCPWYWPPLDIAAERRRAQVKFVEKHVDDPFFRALGFDDDDFLYFSIQALAALSPNAAATALPKQHATPLDK